jgi:polyhydroxybutyrate depolymerase
MKTIVIAGTTAFVLFLTSFIFAAANLPNATVDKVAVGGSSQDAQVFVVEGAKREAIVIAPSKKTDHPPIVFCWHGHGGTMKTTPFKIETIWPEAVVVYPQGLPSPTPLDPSGTKNGWQYEPGQSGDRDLKFFDLMLTKLSGQNHVDPNSVYSVGFSNGAIFTYLLWSQRQSKIAAAAIIAGAIVDADKPLQPMAAFVVAGKQDTICPFQKQVDSIKYDKTVNEVAPNAQAPLQNGVRYFQGNKADLAVMIHNGGHVYPQGTSQKVVTFFQNHKMP